MGCNDASRLVSARKELIELEAQLGEAVGLAREGKPIEIDLPNVERLLRAFRTALLQD